MVMLKDAACSEISISGGARFCVSNGAIYLRLCVQTVGLSRNSVPQQKDAISVGATLDSKARAVGGAEFSGVNTA